MAESHGILLFFFNVNIVYRGGGWDGQQSRVGGGKNYQLGHPWSSHYVSRHPYNGHILLVGPTAVGGILGPHAPPIWHPPLVPLFQL